VLPLFGFTCEGREEYTWVNQQYLWIKCYSSDSESAVTIVRGRILDTTILDGKRLYFVESACEAYSDWPTNTECIESRITLSLMDNFEYDVVGWTEPVDRITPVRDLEYFRDNWTCCD
jgi:hypothetical protein